MFIGVLHVHRNSLPPSKLIGDISVAPQGFVTDLSLEIGCRIVAWNSVGFALFFKVRISPEWLGSEAILWNGWQPWEDAAAKVGECLLKGDVSYLDLPRKRVAAWYNLYGQLANVSIHSGRGWLFVSKYCQRNACWSPEAGWFLFLPVFWHCRNWGLQLLGSPFAECLNFAAMKCMVRLLA